MYNDSLSFISQFAGKSLFMQFSIYFFRFFLRNLWLHFAGRLQACKMAGKQACKMAGNRMWFIMKKGEQYGSDENCFCTGSREENRSRTKTVAS